MCVLAQQRKLVTARRQPDRSSPIRQHTHDTRPWQTQIAILAQIRFFSFAVRVRRIHCIKRSTQLDLRAVLLATRWKCERHPCLLRDIITTKHCRQTKTYCVAVLSGFLVRATFWWNTLSAIRFFHKAKYWNRTASAHRQALGGMIRTTATWHHSHPLWPVYPALYAPLQEHPILLIMIHLRISDYSRLHFRIHQRDKYMNSLPPLEK